VVTVVVRHSTTAYTELLTPLHAYTRCSPAPSPTLPSAASLAPGAAGLALTAVLTMLLVFTMDAIMVLALSVNIYGFSRKIFHLPVYTRIL
jgi:hypothetical protein